VVFRQSTLNILLSLVAVAVLYMVQVGQADIGVQSLVRTLVVEHQRNQ